MSNYDQILTRLHEWFITNGPEWGLKLFKAALILIIGRIVIAFVSKAFERIMVRAKVETTLSKFLARIATVLMLIVVVLAALDAIGVKTTSVVAILGAAGLAVGLALQGSLSNFAAGVMIIIFRPFSVGQFIDAGGTKGIVEEISIFHTKMRTPDNLAVIVPNSQVNGGVITNYAAKPQRRVDLSIGVSYDDDLKVAQKVIWDVVKADSRILTDPAPIIGVNNLGESSVDIVCWVWVNSSDFLNVKFYLNETIKTSLEAAGCSIPYPQRDVHLYTETKKAPPAGKA